MSEPEVTYEQFINAIDETVPEEEVAPTEVEPPKSPARSPKRGRPRKNPLPEQETVQPSIPRPAPSIQKPLPPVKNPETEKEDILNEISMYQNSEVLGPLVQGINVKASDSAEVLKDKLKKMKARLSARFIQTWSQNSFEKGMAITEKAMVQYLKLDHMRGVSDFVIEQPELYKVEIEELAIDMAKNYSPGPFTRLLMNVGSAMMTYHTEAQAGIANQEYDEEGEDIDISE